MAARKSSRASRKYETIYGPTSSAISMTRLKKPSRLTADVTPLAETKAGSIDNTAGHAQAFDLPFNVVDHLPALGRLYGPRTASPHEIFRRTGRLPSQWSRLGA